MATADPLTALRAEDATALRAAGIELDPTLWLFQFWMRNGAEIEFHLTPSEKSRLEARLDADGDVRFAGFDAGGLRVVMNLDHMLGCMFVPEQMPESLGQFQTQDEAMDVYVTYASADEDPRTIAIAPDEAGDPSRNVASFLTRLETADGRRPIARFRDRVGSVAMINATEVALFTIPRAAFEPALLALVRESVEEEARYAGGELEAMRRERGRDVQEGRTDGRGRGLAERGGSTRNEDAS